MAKGKKTGGRKLGTPNNPDKKKLNASLTAHSITYYTAPVPTDKEGRTQFEIDLAELEPRDRIAAETRLLNKSVADLKSTDVNLSESSAKITIEERLRALSENT